MTNEPERTSPKRRAGGNRNDEGVFKDMYDSLRSHRKKKEFDDEGGGGGGGAGGGTGGKHHVGGGVSSGHYTISSGVVDHTRQGRSHTEDMSRSREIGRNAVNYLDNQGVSTPKWVRSVLHVEGGGGGGGGGIVATTV